MPTEILLQRIRYCCTITQENDEDHSSGQKQFRQKNENVTVEITDLYVYSLEPIRMNIKRCAPSEGKANL